jgi:hypothetical protein
LLHPARGFAIVLRDLAGRAGGFHVGLGPGQADYADEDRGRVVQDEARVGRLLGNGDELAGCSDVDEFQSGEVEMDLRSGREGCECLADLVLCGEVCLAF